MVHPYDDWQTMAGQATVGLELASYAQDQNLDLVCVAAPCGGGGLMAGVGSALRFRFPGVQLVAVEPSGYNDHQLSLQQQARVRLGELPPTLCDALQAPTPGERTFEINRRLLTDAITVSDAQVLQAMRFALLELKLVLEPGGAVALAALMAGKLPAGDGALGLVLSGGNLDTELLIQTLAMAPNP